MQLLRQHQAEGPQDVTSWPAVDGKEISHTSVGSVRVQSYALEVTIMDYGLLAPASCHDRADEPHPRKAFLSQFLAKRKLYVDGADPNLSDQVCAVHVTPSGCHVRTRAPPKERSRKGTESRSPLARDSDAPLDLTANAVALSAPPTCRKSPASTPCSPPVRPRAKIGGAWDEPADASTIGHAGRWAHSALQKWVAGAGGTQKEMSWDYLRRLVGIT